jgi:wyosine [tRNA(Phe)-imidazoG37] synthetase (radical SAM superfamily)
MNGKACTVECAVATLDGGRPATAFGCPRDFLENRFVYTVISPRARGMSIGVNMNPDKKCNFDCIYCEVNRDDVNGKLHELDVNVMAAELQNTLLLVHSGGIRERCAYRTVSNELLTLRHVALSGDGEPTLSPNFSEVVESVIHVRAKNPFMYFKLVLITNGSGLDLPNVQQSLKYFTRDDEVWIKLDAGTQEYMDEINRSEVPLDKIISNILLVAHQRPVIIQSLFAKLNDEEPPADEIDEYINRLQELKNGGAKISMVQIYSATRPISHGHCGHLPLKYLSNLRQRIKSIGLRAEVF